METKERPFVRFSHNPEQRHRGYGSWKRAAFLSGLLAVPMILSAQTDDSSLKVAQPLGSGESVNADQVKKTAPISVQQAVKGKASGLYIQEITGEPGTHQNMFLRGSSSPLLRKNSAADTQPTVFINGVPFIADRSFAYAIKDNDVNPIGPVNNILAGIDISNIETIEVIKDPVELAKLGPLAANGAIWITTKTGYDGGYHFNVDADLAVVTPKRKVTMANGWDELAFRQSFPGYSTSSLPAWLQATDDPNFFGGMNWANDYYETALQYNVNATLGGGNKTANYLATIGTTTNAAGADDTAFSRYNVGFYLNINPFKGAGFNAMIRYSTTNRDRNSSFRDRYAEIEYMPEIKTPLVPTENAYANYKEFEDNTIDENDSKSINGVLGFHYRNHGFHADFAGKADYESAHRRAFWASTMMSGVNFVSVYSGYDRRFLGEASLGFDWKINDRNELDITWKGVAQEDYWHYNYVKGIDGDDDKKPTTNGGNYTQYRYLDEEKLHMWQSAFIIDYNYNDMLTLNAVLRNDAASNVHKNHRWLFTPSFGAKVNLKNILFKESAKLDALEIHGSWSRIGRYLNSDRFVLGSIYTSENMGWANSPIVGSYNGLATITRPYRYGWVGFGTEWPYSDKLEAGLKTSLFGRRLNLGVTLYENRDKNLMLPVPVNHEFGYEFTYRQGMEISNRGVEIDLQAAPLRNVNGWTWDFDFNLAYNKNRLEKLPDGLSQVVINDRMLKTGEATDRFWLLENRGIDAEKNPVWADTNTDGKISDADKVMKGNVLPKLFGNFSTSVKYKNFDLTLDFFGAFGHKAFNHAAYQKYDFVNLDNSQSLDALREVWSWQKGLVDENLPRYNVASGMNPYRQDQDLYLEDASFLKLRNVTLGYWVPVKGFSMYVYVNASNLFTISDFSGDDPEAIDADGVYRGYGLQLPRTVSLGFKFKF